MGEGGIGGGGNSYVNRDFWTFGRDCLTHTTAVGTGEKGVPILALLYSNILVFSLKRILLLVVTVWVGFGFSW